MNIVKQATEYLNPGQVPVIAVDQPRAYFSVQYCTLCAVLMKKCAVLDAKMCSIEMFCLQSTKANGIRTLFEATGNIIQRYMVLCYMMYQEDILHHTSLC